ncbi:FAD/NAD(P)-binding protein [Brevundimonas sp.]|uniref:FAD/NAD(P)-binding protein n=1 Tax=Brevundimonas sp. TaxID=1871086 RepID=UPI002FCAA092
MSTLPVLIIGGGFSGAMLAARLAEKGRASLIIEQEGSLALGVAYGTTDDTHRLNVRAANMGAIASDPAHFLKWLEQHHPDMADGDAFISRRLYGAYLMQRLNAVRTACHDLIQTVQGRALAIHGHEVALDDGRTFAGSAIVIATGNPAPRADDTPTCLRIINDPWADGALDAIQPNDSIFILGTSLTMADMVLGLKKRGWTGKAAALSRRGLMPRPHIHGHPPAPPMPEAALTGPLSKRLHTARQMATSMEWQRVMDGYRPVTERLWQEASQAQRARFLRHLRPWWDVHRHRIAPDVFDTLSRLQADGHLVVHAGRLNDIAADENALEIRWTPAPRTSDSSGLTRADWFINCTGPAHDAAHTPLTASLMAAGRARLEPLGQGLDLDSDGRLVNSNGEAEPTLFALGPPTRAAYWESTAVPDIRQRIEALSDLLAQ